jgi:hypothetical protein
MLDDQGRGLIRRLLYPAQFEDNPHNAIDRVLAQSIDQQQAIVSAATVAAIAKALASPESLADLIPQPHSESAVRAYLAQLKKEIESRI